MANGDVEVQNTIGPKNGGDFPTARASELLGGYRSVADANERNGIPAKHRVEGMLVRTNSDGIIWMLGADLSTWTPFNTGTNTNPSGVYNVPSDVGVGDVVYCSDADAADKADADGGTKQPVIGVVVAKTSATVAVVQYAGEVSAGVFSGLSPRATYYLSTTPGQLTATAPSSPGSIIQRIGFAKNPTTLVLTVDQDFIEV